MAKNKHKPTIIRFKNDRSSPGSYYVAICNECGDAFYPLRKDGLYCSSRCTVAAFRKRKAIEQRRLEVEETRRILAKLRKSFGNDELGKR